MAQNIWDDSLKNSLDQTRLSKYLLQDKTRINRIGGTDSSGKAKHLTPLAAACSGGHIKVVELLLKNGALANAPCTHGRTALYHATVDCPDQNRLAIVKALIKANADVNEVYAEYGKSTPLMNAIEEVNDKEVMRALVDANANPKAENEMRRTPEMMAKDRNMEQDLLKKFDRVLASVSTHLVDLAVGAVQLIVAYTDSNVIKSVTKGMVSKLYGITGVKDKDNPVTNIVCLQSTSSSLSDDAYQRHTGYSHAHNRQ
jgi:Ankyrin repeats (3 copies)